MDAAVKHGVPLVVTTSCYSEPEDRPRFEQFRTAEREGGRVVPVFLHCSDEEARRRVGNPDRVRRRKTSSVEEWERFTARWTMAPVPHPDCVLIDTGRNAPDAVAREIIGRFALDRTNLAADEAP